MRWGDTMGRFNADPANYKNDGYLRKYVPAAEAIAQATGTPASSWQALEDTHQRSTREGGKSSCAFLAARFPSLVSAFSAVAALQKTMPTVNLELHVAPDGRRDRGDGIAAYDDSSWINREIGSYIQNEGFGAVVLVDAQNVNRHLAAASRPKL
jgi:hypothetical protein